MFNGIKCVTLDLDDTLWPLEPAIRKAERRLYVWLQKNYPAVTEKYSIEDIAAKTSCLNQQRPDIAHDISALRLLALRELANEFNYHPTLASAGLALFRYHRNQVEPFQHSPATLAWLQARFIVGAVTNGNVQLEQTPLGEYFDFFVSAAEAGVCKPAPEIFLKAAHSAGVKLNDILHIGDSARADVSGALNAGCKAIWFNHKRLPWPGGQTPQAVIHCLSELPALLEIENSIAVEEAVIESEPPSHPDPSPGRGRE